MCKQVIRLLFLSLVFVSGILAGGINTSNIISHVNQIDDYKNVEQQKLKQKPKRLKKEQQYGIRAVAHGCAIYKPARRLG